MPRVSKTPARYRLDLTEQEARVVRRLLEQAEYADLDNRTAGTIARVVRRIQFPNLQGASHEPQGTCRGARGRHGDHLGAPRHR